MSLKDKVKVCDTNPGFQLSRQRMISRDWRVTDILFNRPRTPALASIWLLHPGGWTGSAARNGTTPR